MDKISTIKLTPIEPNARDNFNGAQAVSDTNAANYHVSDSLIKALRKPKRGLTRRAGCPATAKAERVQSSAKRTTVRTSRGRNSGEKPPFVVTLQGQIAICSGVILLALAMKAIDTPQTQSVSATVEQAITTQTDLDQSVGRLQFVQNMFSESVAVFRQKAPEKLQSPFNGRVSAKYSLTTPGIEITGKEASVFACYDGKVLKIDEVDDGSVAITVQHSGGLNTVYAGLQAAQVRAKDNVKKGDVIGVAREKGEGYSMFLQVRLDDVVVDPLPYFQE